MKKRRYYLDGWHTAQAGKLAFYVEDCMILRGVIDGNTVYPFRQVSETTLERVSNLPAYYGAQNRVFWR